MRDSDEPSYLRTPGQYQTSSRDDGRQLRAHHAMCGKTGSIPTVHYIHPTRKHAQTSQATVIGRAVRAKQEVEIPIVSSTQA